ncbi:hypothetical protein KFL_005090050 [Klebsormidium nitens]|uniref:Uncharacterized protein n=1 Tax=Klebsormidium nitens TaxID=105231 RepID=A0A1Y1IIL4_KLENI|nr:hypothetical protein KFL_005090050 [Klebsormidium nitens]|eukprot:GAQ89309.1 hypothetical protein KFL_005090050 [Klebsormidium nitens]
MSWTDVDAFLVRVNRLQPSNAAGLLALLETFVAANEDPGRSPNFRNQNADSLDRLVSLLKDPGIEQHPGLALAALKALKILSRKKPNRLAMRGDEKRGGAIQAVMRFLQAPGKVDNRIAAEGANVILNACYERENVEVVLQHQGTAPLVNFLGAADKDLQANAAGALQSVCFQAKGRTVVREADAIPPLISLLASDSLKVRTRAVGALHNMSSDVDSIRIIRRKDGIPPLIKLLRSPQPAIAGSAAGALQNVSREVASRQKIRGDSDAVRALADLLVEGKELQTQVCAAGALLNILGPELAEKDKGGDEAARKGFARIIVSCLVISMAYDSVFGAGGFATPVS